jgi:uncharacterized protein
MSDVPFIDAGVYPLFPTNDSLREYLPEEFRSRGIPTVEPHWYQTPGGDYHDSLYAADDRRPGSDPARVAQDLFETLGAAAVILNPPTRGNLPDYLLNDAICSATNEWLAERWLEEADRRFRGSIRVNPEHPEAAVREIELWADHPGMVQVGVPLQSREPYGKPQFLPIWRSAAEHGLPVAVRLNSGAGIDYPPTPSGHPRTHAQYATCVPLNYFYHLASLLIEGVFEHIPSLTFVFADGGIDTLTSLIWRLDTFWRAFRDQTPWVSRYPSGYLAKNVRFCSSMLDGPDTEELEAAWLRQLGKDDLMMYASSYPYWSLMRPDEVGAGVSSEQATKVLWANAAALYGIERDRREDVMTS